MPGAADRSPFGIAAGGGVPRSCQKMAGAESAWRGQNCAKTGAKRLPLQALARHQWSVPKSVLAGAATAPEVGLDQKLRPATKSRAINLQILHHALHVV